MKGSTHEGGAFRAGIVFDRLLHVRMAGVLCSEGEKPGNSWSEMVGSFRNMSMGKRAIGRIMKTDIMDRMSASEARSILKQIVKENGGLKKRITELAEDLLRDVDVEEVCGDVYFALDGIDVHELWDRSGAKTDGYTSPEDMAFEMVEGALEPFLQEMRRLCDLKMRQEAKRYCMGILKGLRQYEKDSESEFKDWATDIPGESFQYVLDEWKKSNSNSKDRKEMKDFISSECPDWAD